jgi:hypothetical protein
LRAARRGAGAQPLGHAVVRALVGEDDGGDRAGRGDERDALGPRGLEHVQTAGPRRPVDVRFAPDGNTLYVVDIGAITVLPTMVPTAMPFPGTGVVWRITREGGGGGPPANLSPLSGRGQPSTRPR